MKTIEPRILAMYLGCPIKIPRDVLRKTRATLKGVCESADYKDPRVQVRLDVQDTIEWYDIEQVKPILRRLEDMTEDEARNVFVLMGWGPNLGNIVVMDYGVESNTFGQTCIQRFNKLTAETFAWLLSKSFDLFNLIPDGLAIDAKTLEKENV